MAIRAFRTAFFALLASVVALGWPSFGIDWAADGAAENRAPFTLTDQTGRTVTDRDFAGRFMLIFFGYTHCPDICPTDLTVMSDAVDLLGDDAEAVQPIFITIDPARDTVAVMADYVKHFHPRLVGLTGTQEQIQALSKLYGVRSDKYRVEDDTGAPPPDDAYFMDHTGATYLVGPNGAGLTYFLHGVPAEDIADTIKQFIDRAS